MTRVPSRSSCEMNVPGTDHMPAERTSWAVGRRAGSPE